MLRQNNAISKTSLVVRDVRRTWRAVWSTSAKFQDFESLSLKGWITSPSERNRLMTPKNLLTEAEARELLRLSKHTLRRLRRLGRGPRWARLGNRILYRSEDLEAWVQASSTTPDCKKSINQQNKEKSHD